MNIYVTRAGKSHGPINLDELHRLLQSGEVTGSTPAIVEGWPTWQTVREVPGVNVALIPPSSPSAIGSAIAQAGSDFGKAPATIRTAVIGLGIWWLTLAIAVTTAWIVSHSCYFGAAENILAGTTFWFLPLALALLSGASWARPAAIVSIGVTLAAVTFLPDLTSALSSLPILAAVPGIIGKLGLALALLSVLKTTTPSK